MKKTNVFKKMINSLYNIKELPKYMFEGLGRAVLYLLFISSIFGILQMISPCVSVNKSINKYIDLLQEDKYNFKVSDGVLKAKTSPIIQEENNFLIYVDDDISIKDTKKLKSKTVNYDQYILILKDGVNICVKSMDTKLIDDNYNYGELLLSSDFDNKDLSNQLSMAKIPTILIMIIFSILTLFISNLWIAVVFGFMGYITSMTLGLRLRYKQLVSLVAYTITLPLLATIIFNIFMPTIDFSMILYIVPLLLMSLVLWDMRKINRII